MFEYGYYLIL